MSTKRKTAHASKYPSNALLKCREGRPEGYRVLFRFIGAFIQGEIPSTPETTKLFVAFGNIIFNDADPMSALKLKFGKGRLRLSEEEQFLNDREIAIFIATKLKQDQARGATTRAIKSAAEKFIKSDRYIETIWKRSGGWARISGRPNGEQ